MEHGKIAYPGRNLSLKASTQLLLCGGLNVVSGATNILVPEK